jgi:protein MAK16
VANAAQSPCYFSQFSSDTITGLRDDYSFRLSCTSIPPRHTVNFAMQNDEVIWQIINHGFCSFKTKIARERTFCQNVYNVTGLCLRSACPLANSQYATIREEEGVCYLFMKTIERAHTPKNMWEKIRLPANYTKALELVSTQLEYFPKYLQHRNKQRLTKIHQMLIRMRKLKLRAK